MWQHWCMTDYLPYGHRHVSIISSQLPKNIKMCKYVYICRVWFVYQTMFIFSVFVICEIDGRMW